MNNPKLRFSVLALLAVWCLIVTPVAAGANTAPVVTNVQAAQREGSFVVDITYDLMDAEGDSMWVRAYFSPDGGSSWPVYCSTVAGDVGTGMTSGVGRSIEWDARSDYGGQILSTGRIRIVADDEPPYPYFDGFWRSDLGGGNEIPFALGDTIGFGQSFRLRWRGVAPAIVGMDPLALATLDTVFPFDDGLLGSKYFLASENCFPALNDCWHPRFFDEATGDSISYFGGVSSLAFLNDGSGADPLSMLLPDGSFEVRLNTLDVLGQEVLAERQPFNFVVNYDPETIMLNGETDWSHPSDPEIYPYYIRLNDPAQTHYPFVGGERIPDRTYVVFKALARDDRRDGTLDNNFKIGFTGFMQGVRQDFTGGTFSFNSESSELRVEPPWDALCDTCWYADTLGFLTAPNTEFTMNMQAVDEHGRRDGSPAKLSFDVGFPPCLQCVELLPKTSSTSAWNSSLECVDDPATHPCFQDVTELTVARAPGPDDLEYKQNLVMLVDKQTYFVSTRENGIGFEQTHYVVPARLYSMSVLLHGQDDPREAWTEPVRRTLGWEYQIDYNCDPYNQIKDGGGNDDILDPTWGEPGDGVGLSIDNASGVWRLDVDVVVPENLFLSPETYLLLLTVLQAGNDPEIAEAIFEATTKQFGSGEVRAVTLDQTQCGINPIRPGRYNYFKKVRPSLAELPEGQTWRDCNLFVPDIKDSLPLSQGAMRSGGGVAVTKQFRLVIKTDTGGDYVCEF